MPQAPGQPRPLSQAGAAPWELRPASLTSPACPAQASSHSFPLLPRTGLPEAGSEEDQRERRTAIQGGHEAPPQTSACLSLY